MIAALAYGAVLWIRPESMALSNAVILASAIALAPLLGRSLGSFGGIVAFAVTVSAVDLLSFGGGLTRQIIQDYRAGTGDLLRFLAVTVPLDSRPTPLVGVSDLVIMGALSIGLTRLHGDGRRAIVVLLSALALATLVGIGIGGVAALPFLGFAAVADAWLAERHREVSEEPAGCT